MELTEAQLAKWDALTAAATPGLWKADVRFNPPTVVVHRGWIVAHMAHYLPTQQASDAAFIAAAHTALPALLAEVRRLQLVEAAMADHLPGCDHITGYYALENDCSCGLYERQQVLQRLAEGTLNYD